jgi:hypothetical protein
LKVLVYILLFISFSASLYSQDPFRGVVVEKDSTTVMPYVYVINKANGNGAMSNLEGKFLIIANPNDTLICSYVGYAKQFIPVKSLKKNNKGDYVIVMRNQYINLNTVTVSTFKYKPYERDYMKKIIDESQIRTIDAFGSPITAAYMQFSRRGREIRKLAQIFNDILIEEEVNKKINPQIVRNLTGDQKLDYENFRKYCLELNNQFILSHDGFELYNRVMECYKRYKSEDR